MGTAHAHRDGAQVELRRRMRGNQNSRKMSAHSPKVDGMEADEARLREGAVAKAQLEQKIAEAKKELEKISTQLERWGQTTRVNKATPMALVSPSEVEAIPMRAGPISTAPMRTSTSTCMITSNPAPIPPEIPRMDAFGKEAVRTLKPHLDLNLILNKSRVRSPQP